MNYLTELKAFSEFTATNRIPANTQALWYKLMEYNNRFKWNPRFRVSTKRLCDDLNISRQQFTRARKTLARYNLITYTNGANQFSIPIYSINSLAKRKDYFISDFELNRFNELGGFNELGEDSV